LKAAVLLLLRGIRRFHDEMKAAYNISRAVHPGMIKRHYVRLIYITSGSARYTMPNGAIALPTAKSAWSHFPDISHKDLGDRE
jgi:NADP-dependent 3-hydroxy acid dehydrogenase YdfG